MAEETIPVLLIVGPTAVGKTEAAVLVAEHLGGEIVSADSRQIYRGMDIGTAQPEPELLRRVPHHLVGIVEPSEPFNAVRYASLAREAILDIHARGRAPIVVGGSGLYIRALIDGLFLGPPASPRIRAELMEVARTLGPREIHARLRQVDPEAAARIHQNDVLRVVRALEVFRLTGDSISRLQERLSEDKPPLDPTLVGLTRDRRDLYSRIDARVDRMMAAGLADELRRLVDLGGEGQPGLDAVGYRELVTWLRGDTSLEEAVRRIKRNTRRYAKRQITWFARDPRVVWIPLVPSSSPEEIAQAILSRFKARGT